MRWFMSLLLGAGLLFAGCPTPTDPDGGADVVAIDAPADVRAALCVGDDECDDENFCNGLERCEPTSASADSRGCVPSRGRPCLAAQVCDEALDTCVTDCGASRDADADGEDAEVCGGRDCDDADPLRLPGATEVCDDENRDEDCDSATFGQRDLDRDGVVDAACCNVNAAGVDVCGTDCDDTRRSVRPLGAEVCDGLDNDCSGTVDEGVTVPGFTDMDADLHGAPMAVRMACAGSVRFSVVGDDCLDTDSSVHGAQLEICDGLDNDCDTRIDEHARPATWYRDADGDGFGAASSGTMVSCIPVANHSLLATDCDDGNASRHPAAEEICDGADDDCNGLFDFSIGINDREDDDGDGHLDASCGGDDCDDSDPSAFLGAPEICDFRDSDCDGLADRGAAPPAGVMADTTEEIDWFTDTDGDRFGSPLAPMRSCPPVLGRVSDARDCADDNPMVHPFTVDVCNDRDDDCDMRVDETATTLAFYADPDGDGSGDGAATLSCEPPATTTLLPGDCAPSNPLRGPDAIETCNRVDDDCDARIDEALFRDADGDGHGDPSMPSTGTCMPTDVGLADDCDDSDPLVGPAGTCVELCNGFDEDRDGTVDEGAAAACPNQATSNWTCTAGACVLGGCRAMGGDCNGLPTDGCEHDLATDSLHCGSCAELCDFGEACSAGVCDDPIVDVACNAQSTMVRRASGTVLYWGGSGAAVATAGPATASHVPETLPSLSGATAIELRISRGCATVGAGRVCWGAQRGGSLPAILGDGTRREVVTPTSLFPPGLGDIGLGMEHTCAIRTTIAPGSVLCWGGPPTGAFLALGDGSSVGSAVPVQVLGLGDATAVEAGRVHTCAIRTSGHVVCWGSNGSILGIGTAITSGRAAPIEEVQLMDGSPLTGVAELAISSPGNVSTGGGATCARLAGGTVMCWGEHSHGGTGRGALGSDTAADRGYAANVVAGPGMTTPLTGATRLDAGAGYFCVERPDGLWCWGRNTAGQLGIGTMTSGELAPARVPLPAFSDWCVGDQHACALLTDGRLFCWGDNNFRQLGFDGSIAPRTSPTEVTTLYRGPP